MSTATPNHRSDGKFKRRNTAALRSQEQGVLDVRGELFRSSQQQARWEQALDLENIGRPKKLSLQDWIRQVLDARARSIRRSLGHLADEPLTTPIATPATPAVGQAIPPIAR